MIDCHLTFDIDWAPDWSVRESLSLLEEHGCPATFFITHASPEEVRVLKAREHVPDFDFLAVPGQVCFASSEGNPVFATGDGMVELLSCADDSAAKAAILHSLRNRLV